MIGKEESIIHKKPETVKKHFANVPTSDYKIF